MSGSEGLMYQDGSKVFMAWFIGKPRHGMPNEGLICFYCYATYQSRYKHTGKTTAELRTLIGGDSDAMQLFMGRKDSLIEWCKENKGRHTRCDWTMIDKRTLDLLKVREIAYEDPVDEHWDYATYCAETAAKLNHRPAQPPRTYQLGIRWILSAWGVFRFVYTSFGIFEFGELACGMSARVECGFVTDLF